jgi:hypothetical protein
MMQQNISLEQDLPKLVVAVAAAVGAIYAPNFWLRTVLAGVAATVSASVVFGTNGMSNAEENRDRSEEPHWRTIKTFRVEA